MFFDEAEERSVPAYVSLSSDRLKSGGGYRATREVFSDPSMRAEFLRTAASELEVFQDRYHRFTELQEVFSAAKKFKSKIIKTNAKA